jgi:hypothetical protein
VPKRSLIGCDRAVWAAGPLWEGAAEDRWKSRLAPARLPAAAVPKPPEQ